MDKVYILLFYSFQFFIKITPKFLLKIFLDTISSLIYTLDKKHKHVAKVNLDLAYEDRLKQNEKIDIIKGCYKNLLYTLADFIKNQGAKKEDLLKKVEFKNQSIIEDAIKSEKKIIIMTAHYGNWELLALSIAAKFTPLAVVGRDLDSPSMNKILTKNREQFDIRLLSKIGAMKGMVKSLKESRPVGILVDQNTKESEGILIDFFGKKARHTTSIAVLAKKFDAIIVPAYIKSKSFGKYTVEFYEPFYCEDSGDKELDILNCVQKQADITQKVIESSPNEWFWLHQRWKNQYEKLYKREKK